MTQELHGVISLGGTVIGGSLYQRGLKGETGNGIESVVMTEEYDLVITYTDGDVVTLDTGLDDYEELLKGYKDDAESAKSDAESAKTDAVDAKNDAVSAKSDAVSAKNDAVSAKNDAESAKSDAVSAKNDAVSAKTDAQTAKTAAETAQGKAESSASDSEAYAVGTRGGTPVSSGDVAYENNSKYMKEQAAIYTLQADSYAGESELWATGELDGTPVGNTYPQYENNSKYYAGEASSSATSAGGSASSAETEALKSEGFAVGEQNGTPVTSGSPYYHNNAKYYSENLINILPTDTASGAIASFPDGSDLFDYLSCIVDIDPVQDLHGYDKPWVGGAGKNLFDESTIYHGYYNSTDIDNKTANEAYRTVFIDLSAGTYTFSTTLQYCYILRVWYDGTNHTINATRGTETFTTTTSGKVGICFRNTSTTTITETFNTQVETGSTATAWQPYENLCPITGWTGCEVSQAGVNLLTDSYADFSTANSNYAYITDLLPSNTLATMSFTDKDTTVDVSGCYFGFVNNYSGGSLGNYHWCIANGSVVSRTDNRADNHLEILCNGVFMYPKTEETFNKLFSRYNIQVELGSTATPYTPYNGTVYPVSWQTEAGTVYGCTVDVVSGVLTAYPYYASYNGETLVAPWVSSMDEYIEGRTPTTGAQVVDLGGTPTTYQLDPVQVACLLGQNNVWADCGDIEEVKYKADVQKYIDKKTEELSVAILALS